MSRRTALISSIGIATLCALVFASTASAHSLTARDALDKLRPYVQRVVDDPTTPYTQAHRTCTPGVPHRVGCTIGYDTPQTRADEDARQAAWVCPVPPRTPCGPRRPKRIAPWACVEEIQVYSKPHSGIATTRANIYAKHMRGQCGRTRLLGG